MCLHSVLNVKAIIDIVNQKKALVASRGLLRDCEIFGNIRITFVSSFNKDPFLKSSALMRHNWVNDEGELKTLVLHD